MTWIADAHSGLCHDHAGAVPQGEQEGPPKGCLAGSAGQLGQEVRPGVGRWGQDQRVGFPR